MKKIALLVVAVLATACVLAQEKPRRGGGRRHQRGERPAASERQMGGGGMMHAAGAWIPRMFANKANMERIGVTDEALRTKLLTALKPLQERGDGLDQKIREVSREQFKLMQGLVKDKGADPKAVMDKIDEVAKLRAEQGRLSVRALLVLRDNLSTEQLEKVCELIRERGRMRHGGMGPGGERPAPPPDGSAPRDKPFASDQ